MNSVVSTPSMPSGLGKIQLAENSSKVISLRHLRRGSDGNPIETPEEMIWRVAYHVARVEKKWGKNPVAQSGILTSDGISAIMIPRYHDIKVSYRRKDPNAEIHCSI